VEAVKAQNFDVVLMDVQMPEMGGFDATAGIRALERGNGSRLPIIAMTAHAMKGDRERCLAAGMDEYLTKPLDPRQLCSLVEEMAAGRAAAAFDAADVPTVPVQVLARVGGDRQLLAQTRRLLGDDAARPLQPIR